MARGGARVGAGRKPKAASRSVVVDARSRFSETTLPPAPAVPADLESLVEPPEGMPETHAKLWRKLAPHAIAQQTLVTATRPGFAELVEQLVMKQQLADSIAQVGAAHPGADGLLRHYTKLAQRLDATMARFRLTALGKPEAAAARKVPVTNNAWAVAPPASMAGTKA